MHFLIGLVILALDIWAILQIFKSGADDTKKILWTILVLVAPFIGLVIWYLAGPRK